MSDATSRAQEALELFKRIEKVTQVFDTKDDERIRVASTPKREARADEANVQRRTTPLQAKVKPDSELNDAVLKKLHARNKELSAQVDELTSRLSSTGSAKSLLAVPKTQSDSMAIELAVVRGQCKQLQKQLDDLRKVNLSYIQQGEGTGKVNKEVKAFFQATRAKFIDDAARLEAERTCWGALALELERSLCAAQCGDL